MSDRNPSDIKSKLHPRSAHRQRYDLNNLSQSYPQLCEYIYTNQYEDETIDFFNPQAVSALNKALLKTYYQIDAYDLPSKYLCPPVPGRADYIHHVADLLLASDKMNLGNPKKHRIKCLDIGTGANCIYPILGGRIYDWEFVASDFDKEAINTAKKIIDANENLIGKIELRLQEDPGSYFSNIIRKNEKYAISICNPPFHSSAAEAQKATSRKLKNLKQKPVKGFSRNFSGTNKELWCEGGEKQFIANMIKESKNYADCCDFFTSLVSKESNLPALQKVLQQVKPKSIQTIKMGQGNKQSRIIVWSYTL